MSDRLNKAICQNFRWKVASDIIVLAMPVMRIVKSRSLCNSRTRDCIYDPHSQSGEQEMQLEGRTDGSAV